MRLLLGLLGVVVAGAGIVLMFAWPSFHTPPRTHFGLGFGSADDYAVGSVTTVPKGRFHLVRVSEKEFVALSWRDPHSTCIIPWRPTFAWPDPFNGGVITTGWFRDPCHGSTYNKEGIRVFGPAPRNMDRYTVTIVNNIVSVDTSQYVCGFAPPGGRCVAASTSSRP